MDMFELYKVQCCGLMDTQNIHDQKVQAAKNDLEYLTQNGCRPEFYIDDVLHHNELSYCSLTQSEISYILGKT